MHKKSVKILTIDLVIAKFKYLIFDPIFDLTYVVRGWGKIFVTVMLLYRHRKIMAYSEKLADIKALDKYEVNYTKKPNTALAL